MHIKLSQLSYCNQNHNQILYHNFRSVFQQPLLMFVMFLVSDKSILDQAIEDIEFFNDYPDVSVGF